MLQRSASPPPRPRRLDHLDRRCTPADDLTDLSPYDVAAADATVVLSRQVASLGIYPRGGPVDSTSRQLDPVVGEEHYNTARGVRAVLQRYKELKDIIAILGMDELSWRTEQVVSRP